MRRISIVLMGIPFAAGLTAAACGSDDGAGFDPDPNGRDGATADGPTGGGFEDGSGNGDGGFRGDGAAVCASGDAKTTRTPVYLDIILDGSRSMDGHGAQSPGPCDDRYAHTGGSCFLKDSRETDPQARTRELRVCHSEGDSDQAGEAATNCRNFIGLTGKKWLAARGALTAYFNGQTASPKLGVGMYLFESSVKKAATAWDVPIKVVDADHATELRDRIAPGIWGSGGTPLKASIDGQAGLLLKWQPAAPLEANGKRVILLITDGVPNGSSTDQAVVDSVKLARAGKTTLPNGQPDPATYPPALTAVVGIGEPDADPASVYNAKFLATLAKEGGASPQGAGCVTNWTGTNPPANACHIQVTPGSRTAAQIQADITAAIDKIANSLQSCTLPLEGVDPNNIDVERVNVVYTPSPGQGPVAQLPKGPNGWGINTPPSVVTLLGDSCNKLKADPGAKVKVVIGCKTGDPVIN